LPSFTGLRLCRDQTLGYSFFVPLDWHALELESVTGAGAMYAPVADDPLTSFSAEGRDLGTTVTAADVPALKAGFLAGLRKLPRSVIESSEAEAIGRLVTMEARHTFREGKVTRKRWVRLLYQGSLQVRLVAQGATVEQFEYWLPMFFESMRTFQFGDWAATLREGDAPGP
jgi:hypothetical protein